MSRVGLTYDTGALLAAESGDARMWHIHRRALERGVRPVVPVGVLGQAWRGGPQAELSRLLRGCLVEELDEARSRSAGGACGAAGTDDLIDATVAVGAIARTNSVVTSDVSDLHRIANALRARIDLIPI